MDSDQQANSEQAPEEELKTTSEQSVDTTPSVEAPEEGGEQAENSTEQGNSEEQNSEPTTAPETTNAEEEETPASEAAPTAPIITSSAETTQATTESTNASMKTPEAPAQKAGLSRFWKRFIIIAAVVIVLLGGSAAAFYTVYLPKQPWYILDTALKNTLAENNFSINTTGNLNVSNGLAIKLASLTATDLNNKQVDENLTLTVAGTNIPLEIRVVNGNLYFKFGDLSGVSSLLALAGSSVQGLNLGSVLTPVLSTLSNQWVVVDSTLLDQNKDLRCLLNSSWVLSSSDSNYMVNTYFNQPFLTVNSSTSGTLNSASEDVMSVTLNNNLAAKYFSGLNNLNASKSYANCIGVKLSSTPAKSSSSLNNNKNYAFTIWVNKSTKLIDKIEFTPASASASQGTSFSGPIDMTLTYGTASIQAPKNAIPLLQLISGLTQSLKGDPQLLNSVNPYLSKL